jgi:hypothetical protein
MTDRPMAAVTSREVVAAVGALALAIALLPQFGGGVLWTRPLWLDEICCTVYPVSHAATPLDVVRNIVHREDYAPPLLHLIVWSAGRVAGGLTPVVLRSVSLTCVSLALLFVYLTLRRRFDRAPRAAGAIAVATHALVLTHAFEGRFYGPWLLFAAGFAWSLSSGGALRMASTALFSIFLVTIHWFGVLSLGLMVAGAMATRGRDWRAGLRIVAPGAAGFIALVVCAPMAIAQRSAATGAGALWVPELSAAQIGVIVRLFFLTTVPVVAVILLLVDGLRETGERPSVGSSIRSALRDPGVAALASLALMPVTLIVVSVVLQPSMLDRYAIVTVVAWAPFVALAVETLGRTARRVAIAVLVILVALAARRSIAERRGFAKNVAANRAAFAGARALNLPIVFQSLHVVYPVAGEQRSERFALFLELPDSTIAAMVPQPKLEWVRRTLRIERDIARSHARVYQFPVMVTQAQLDSTRRFVLIASDESLPPLYKSVDLFTERVFPHHRLSRLSPTLALLTR